MPVHVRFGPLVIDEPLVQWINEGLMVFFFVLVGLEIKRQFLEGHLSTWKCAASPAIAAFGGMIAPAAVYWIFTSGDPAQTRGWAIPTATDIVLALGILSLLGTRVPTGLKVFLTALAIFDDVGAVLIIGLFYGEGITLAPLFLAGLAISGVPETLVIDQDGVIRYRHVGPLDPGTQEEVILPLFRSLRERTS